MRFAHFRTISIHAPREGSDIEPGKEPALMEIFLSTLPARGATFLAADLCLVILISIHAPREGSDNLDIGCGNIAVENFYPRSPRGERLLGC